MKIKSLEIKNFKLFEEKFDHIQNLERTDLILLNGPNGYGKTTVFDAIELALTGKIKRIHTYNNDLGVAKNEKSNRKILVADASRDAYVRLTLVEADCELVMERVYESRSGIRDNKVSVDNNPHKIFDQFELRMSVNGEQVVREEEQAAVLERYHLNNLEEFFDKCCFLSQDEHLQFLKETKKDKSAALEFLFQVPEELEQRLIRINDIMLSIKNNNIKNNLGHLKILENTQKALSNEITELKSKMEQAHASQEMQEGADIKYQRLFARTGAKWDEKNPLLDEDEYEEALKELENLIYYAQCPEACMDYIWNKPFWDLLKPFNGGENIHYEDGRLEYAYRYFPLIQQGEALEVQYRRQQQLEQLKQNLEKREIYQINWETVSGEELMEQKMLERVREEIRQVEQLKTIQGTADKVITSINEARTVLLQRTEEAIEQKVLTDRECPYCGKVYDEKSVLDERFLAEKEKLLSLSAGTSKAIQAQVDRIYENYLNGVMNEVQVRLQDAISEVIYSKYQDAKRHSGFLKEINQLLQKMELSLPGEYQDDITEIGIGYEQFLKNIESRLRKIPEELLEQLTARGFWEDFDKYYDRDIEQFNQKTVFMLKTKSEYIKRLFYDSGRKLILEKETELEKAKARYAELSKIYRELSEYKTAIEEGIRDYKRSVIHDIEPLLHVYTAKILQQKFCGKSIFISVDKDMRSLQLVNSTEDDQDILYNMSSGQLAAVSLSFLLCMNQVYAQQQTLPILLIDDPIQTIDDVNMVGLVDILRFEFPDTQIFVSTHEQKFEWYLRYKYEKAQRKVIPYNMRDIVLGAE